MVWRKRVVNPLTLNQQRMQQIIFQGNQFLSSPPKVGINDISHFSLYSYKIIRREEILDSSQENVALGSGLNCIPGIVMALIFRRTRLHLHAPGEPTLKQAFL